MSKGEEKIVISDDDEIMLVPLREDDEDPSPKQIYNAIVGLVASHNKLAKDVYGFQKETNDFLKLNKGNIENIPKIMEGNKMLETKMIKLEKQIEFINQKEKLNNIVINGIPKIATDKLPIILHKITKILLSRDVNFEYISAMKVKPGSKSVPIVVNLTHESDKHLLMKKKKEIGEIFIEQLGFDVTKIPNSQVFLSNHLITSVYTLLKEARKLKKRGFEFVWTRNTSVFIQKDSTSQKIKFDSVLELEGFIQNLK